MLRVGAETAAGPTVWRHLLGSYTLVIVARQDDA